MPYLAIELWTQAEWLRPIEQDARPDARECELVDGIGNRSEMVGNRNRLSALPPLVSLVHRRLSCSCVKAPSSACPLAGG